MRHQPSTTVTRGGEEIGQGVGPPAIPEAKAAVERVRQMLAGQAVRRADPSITGKGKAKRRAQAGEGR